jgi:hypothetical protein
LASYPFNETGGRENRCWHHNSGKMREDCGANDRCWCYVDMMKFDALLQAHGFMKTERPPEIWEAETEDVYFIPLLGEMIAAGICGGSPLEQLTLNVSNVVVQPDTSEEAGQSRRPPEGEYVAVTVKGNTDLGPDDSWLPGDSGQGLLGRISRRLVDSGACYGYVRRLPPEGSITVFLRRAKMEA